MRTYRSLTLVALASLCACGTILHGPRQLVTVQSSPTGASLQVAPDSGTFTTPATLNLERKRRYLLTFTSPGYTPATVELKPDVGLGTAVADGFFTGFIGMIVDALDGSLYGLNPESPNVTLSRAPGSSSSPTEIHVRLNESEGGRHLELRSDAKVSVQILRK